MEKITWSNKLNTGVEKIDDQHRRLVKLVNNLVSAIQSGFADDITTPLCHELAEFTSYHFRDEEMLMEEVGYPGLEEQKEQHAKLTSTVQGYLDALERGEAVAPEEMLAFLRQWLVEHIVHCDMRIGSHIRRNQQAL